MFLRYISMCFAALYSWSNHFRQMVLNNEDCPEDYQRYFVTEQARGQGHVDCKLNPSPSCNYRLTHSSSLFCNLIPPLGQACLRSSRSTPITMRDETEICLYILICLLYKESPPPSQKKGGDLGQLTQM